MEDEQHNKPQGPIPLDWDKLLPDVDAPPPELVVKPSPAMASESFAEDLSSCTEHELRESIRSKTRTLDTTRKILKDGGARIIATINRLQDELKRRELKRIHKEVDEDQKQQPKQDTSSSAAGEGLSNDLREENISFQAKPQSTFASSFVKKIEDNTNCTAVDAFKKEALYLKHCDNQTGRDNGNPRGRKRHRSSLRKFPLQHHSNLSKCVTFSDDKINRATSTLSLQNIKRNLSRRNSKLNDASLVNQSDDSRHRKGQPIVLDDDDDVDDDEPLIVESSENKFAEYLKEAKIYFPSRDDPECVEICYTDTECLAPEGYLTSTIMNFYIRYLQQQESLSNKSLSDYHFFNTYFYKKLKEAVSCKQSDKGLTFAKFRRWWKGVNIFQKAYVLIPIHEE